MRSRPSRSGSDAADRKLANGEIEASREHQIHSYLARGRYAEQLERWLALLSARAVAGVCDSRTSSQDPLAVPEPDAGVRRAAADGERAARAAQRAQVSADESGRRRSACASTSSRTIGRLEALLGRTDGLVSDRNGAALTGAAATPGTPPRPAAGPVRWLRHSASPRHSIMRCSASCTSPSAAYEFAMDDGDSGRSIGCHLLADRQVQPHVQERIRLARPRARNHARARPAPISTTGWYSGCCSSTRDDLVLERLERRRRRDTCARPRRTCGAARRGPGRGRRARTLTRPLVDLSRQGGRGRTLAPSPACAGEGWRRGRNVLSLYSHRSATRHVGQSGLRALQT